MHYGWSTWTPRATAPHTPAPPAGAQDDPDAAPERPGPVVVGTDVSAGAVEAIGWALAHAHHFLEPPPVVLTHVVDAADAAAVAQLPTGALPPRQAADATVDVFRRIALQMAPHADVRTEVCEGDVGAQLVAASADASLVVLGSHGRADMTSSVVGSLANRVAAHAGCPVVVVPRASASGAARVVVGAAAEAAGHAALEWAARYAQRTGARLCLVRAAGEAEGGRARAVEELAMLAHHVAGRAPDSDLELVAAVGDPALAVLRAARLADLVVLGCHHQDRRFASRIGTVPGAVWPMAPCPVVLVPRVVDPADAISEDHEWAGAS